MSMGGGLQVPFQQTPSEIEMAKQRRAWCIEQALKVMPQMDNRGIPYGGSEDILAIAEKFYNYMTKGEVSNG